MGAGRSSPSGRVAAVSLIGAEPRTSACNTRRVLNPLISATATELAGRLRSGDVSAVEVVTAHLDRIDEVDGDINAIPCRRERAEVLADAARLDALDAPAGPLHGLPVAVKDLQNVAGLPTSHGSPVMPLEPQPADGLVAARLRAAGAIIIGKTNTPEWGTGSHTFNPVYGLTRNPWNTDHSAGGSSGGAAAALAARMLPIADGSDLGGSLRNPAAFNGVVGLRPTIGTVPNPDSRSHSLARFGIEGPMGRTVADTALVLSVLAGPHPLDAISRPIDPATFAAPLEPATDARIGWIGDAGGAFDADPEPMTMARSAADALGTAVELELALPGAERIFRVIRGISYRTLAASFTPDQIARMKQTVQDNMAFGRTITADDLVEVDRLRSSLHRQVHDVFNEVDVLALPTTQVAPFPVEQEYPTEVAGRPMDDYLDWMMSCCVITATGCPAISLPAGFTAAGLPVGLQLVAPLGGERRLLEVAAAVEAANPHYQQVPEL